MSGAVISPKSSLSPGYADTWIATPGTLAISQAEAWLSASLWPVSSDQYTNDDPRFVYFARFERSLKIGISKKPRHRMVGLPGHRLALIVYDCLSVHESELHSFLAREMIRREYFAGSEVENLFAVLASAARPLSDIDPMWGKRGKVPVRQSRGQQLLKEVLKHESHAELSKRIGATKAAVAAVASGRNVPRMRLSIAFQACGIPPHSWIEPAEQESA